MFLLVLALAWTLLRWRRSPTIGEFSGVLNPVGLIGRAEETFSDQGTVFVQGEIWKASILKGIVQKGDPVRVVALREGLVLEVEKVDQASGGVSS